VKGAKLSGILFIAPISDLLTATNGQVVFHGKGCDAYLLIQGMAFMNVGWLQNCLLAL
jgi:hypothetical protein